MREIAIVVEGPTDVAFWRRLLVRYHGAGPATVDIVSAGGQGTLIRRAETYLRAHRDAGLRATFFVVDLDDYECVRRVLDDFPEVVQRATREDDDVYICVAVLGLESWYLADAGAVGGVFDAAEYSVPTDVEAINPKRELQRLGGRYDKRWLAQRFGNVYDPEVGRTHSRSFDRAWRLISTALETAEDEATRGQT